VCKEENVSLKNVSHWTAGKEKKRHFPRLLGAVLRFSDINKKRLYFFKKRLDIPERFMV
jgi:hypothetical protein